MLKTRMPIIRDDSVISNHQERKSLIISPGVASLFIRTAALQLVGAREPKILNGEEDGFYDSIVRLLTPVSSQKPPTRYKVMQLVRHPFDRMFSVYKWVVKDEVLKHGNRSIDNLSIIMFGPSRDKSEIGEYWYNDHFRPQAHKARHIKGLHVAKLEEDGANEALDWLGLKPVENIKQGREKVDWRNGKWEGDSRAVMTKAYQCDFRKYGYNPSE